MGNNISLNKNKKKLTKKNHFSGLFQLPLYKCFVLIMY